jgi:peptide/nickel transport system ATP-binding protein
MYGGRVVEAGNVRDIFYRPEMPYTWGLLGSIPRVNRSGDQRLKSIRGIPPSLINLPKGCPFQPRCDYQKHVEGHSCAAELPELLQVGIGGHQVRCHIDSEQRKRLFGEQVKPSL